MVVMLELLKCMSGEGRDDVGVMIVDGVCEMLFYLK